jgi:hypothetical protein
MVCRRADMDIPLYTIPRRIALRFFGGLSVEETAEVLKVSPETVKRDWRFAKAWLHRILRGAKGDETGALRAS